MKAKDGYDSESFKAAYEAMDKNSDGKISKAEFMDKVTETAKENGLFDEAEAEPTKVEEVVESRPVSQLTTDE
jgi:Ca2+-binding EF-hand superfamily protein